MNYVYQKNRTKKALQARDRLVFTPWNMLARGFGAIFLLTGLAFVVNGIYDVLGSFHEDGSVWGAFFGGGLFALPGYCLTFYRSRLEFDLTLSRWRQEQGVPPFSKVRAGMLSDWNYVQFDREQRTVQGEGGETTFVVWAVKLRSEGDRLPPLPDDRSGTRGDRSATAHTARAGQASLFHVVISTGCHREHGAGHSRDGLGGRGAWAKAAARAQFWPTARPSNRSLELAHKHLHPDIPPVF